MRGSVIIVTLIIGILLSVKLTDAQVVARAIQPAQVIQQANSLPSATPVPVQASPDGSSPATPAVAENKKTPEQKKVDLLMKTKFDRTTGGMLKAWNDRPEPNQKNVEADQAHPNTATVANVFEGFVVLNFQTDPGLKIGETIELASTAEKSTNYGTAKILSVDGTTVSVKFQSAAKTKPEKTADEKLNHSSEAKAESKSSESGDDGGKPANDQGENVEDAGGEETGQPTLDARKGDAENEGESEVKNNQPKAQAELKSGEKSELAENKTQLYQSIKNGDELIVVDNQEVEKNEDERIKADVEGFVRDVAIGNWEQVKKFLAELSQDDGDKVYGHLLKSLATAPKKKGAAPPRPGQIPPVPNLSPDDILALIDASPKPIEMPEPKKGSDDSNPNAVASGVTPPQVQLPPGVSIEQLPPEIQNQIQQSNGVATVASTTKPGEGAKTANHIPAIAKLIRNSITNGHNYKRFFEKLKEGIAHFGGNDPKTRIAAADLFMKSGLTQYVEEFLPSLDEEGSKTELAALKIWSQYALLKQNQDEMAGWLTKAWQINQDILTMDDLSKTDRDQALQNLISLSSQVEKEVGVAWINSSFTQVPERGMTILTNLGTKSAEMASKANQHPESTRLKLLRLQNEAVEKLIDLSPETAEKWTQALTLLAQNWLKETDISLKYSQQSSRGGFMQIDMYGNYYWQNPGQFNQRGNGRQPRPIKLSDVLEIVPSDKWQQLADPSLRINFLKATANLYLRVNEEDKAFPYIEKISESHADIAKDMVHEFLKIWTKNHDPNSDRRQRNPYIYFYGFDQKADAIPLTRSKQERNLQELSGWVKRIRKMSVGDIDEELLANAFTTCHSSAEVFEIERFRSVFGDLKQLKPETIAAICEKMRANLSSNWRDIRNQEAKQTNRREPEVQQEVLRGYDMAMTLTEEALQSSPENWKLHLAKATLMFDKNAYSQTVQKSSEFSDRRDSAFEQFALAANKYAAAVVELDKLKQSTQVYDLWFYAGLGAVDLGKVTDRTVPDLKQYPLIRQAIESLPGFLAESHMAKFANNLFTRMSPIKPEIKFRYLKGGFEIVGEHPRAWEARNLYDYYKDLVHEIKFSAVVDGDERVGSDQPFGVYVNILHTKEIERESGGFGKYVQNQNNMMYAYNYGRPTENYRDKFTESVEQALGEHFEVMNVTFQSPDTMESRPAAEAGWRITPYAYLLLRAKGSEVDRLAPMKIDLDFLDTSGYVVVPIESPALVIDCSIEDPPIRPVADLKITQTLDERQADEGKLIVEISATAKGLVPELENIIDLERENFEIVTVDDQGVNPTAFEKDTDEIQIVSDRSWTVEYKAAESAPNVDTFAFSDASLEDAKVVFQRYEDADLVEAEQQVALERSYASFSWRFLYWLVPLIAIGLIGVATAGYFLTKPVENVDERFAMPEDVNPFTVLSLLKDIRSRNGISHEQGVELESSIHRIEEYYFGDETMESPDDLASVAETWLRRAK